MRSTPHLTASSQPTPCTLNPSAVRRARQQCQIHHWPVPFNVTVCEGEPKALSLMVIDPLTGPTATGVNVRLNVHLAPGGTTLLAQVVLRSAKGPLTEVLVRYRSSLPPLIKAKF